MQTTVLDILDRIESMRLRAINNPDAYSVDYCLRVAEGILSAEFGFKSRSAWLEALRKIPTSEVHKRSFR